MINQVIIELANKVRFGHINIFKKQKL